MYWEASSENIQPFIVPAECACQHSGYFFWGEGGGAYNEVEIMLYLNSQHRNGRKYYKISHTNVNMLFSHVNCSNSTFQTRT